MRMRAPRPPRPERSAMELLEHAAAACAQDLPACLEQVAASLAFVAALAYALIYFERAPLAWEHAGLAGLGLALAHLWLKQQQAAFAVRLGRRFGLEHAQPQVGGRWRNQAVWQPWSLLLLPLAAVAVLPLPHVSAFFHNLAVLDDGRSGPRQLGERAWALSKRQVMQLQLVHGMLLILGAMVFINLLAAVFGVALLGQELLGLQSALTRDPRAAVNSTFFLLCLGAAWALLQPVAKAVHVLRASEAGAAAQGHDLALRLEALQAEDPL